MTASLTEIIRQIKFIFLAILIILIVLSIIDFIYQKWEYEQDIKMKKEEVKQEHKDNEGDPQVKGKRKTLCMPSCKGLLRKRWMVQRLL
ncbi:EscU/YscU/HrcU family type III secretion system export apparatus switch protein [Bacillus toyonensis]